MGLPEPPRTLLRPELCPPLPSQLPQSTTALLQLTLSPRPELPLQSDSTPGSLPRSPTLSPRSRSTSTTLMSQLPSPGLSPVRSLLSRRLPSHTRSQYPEPSLSQLLTRSTQSKRLLRPPTSTTRQLRPTPPRLL